MKFGLFDHVDRSDRPLATQFDERLEFVSAADQAGFYCYHVAEHHATPLNMVPVPGVYLGAVARLTEHIRLGPLVYLLPLYSPLRLIEEICMLDQLSHGRLDVGVGRGVSPFELNFHNVDSDTAREVFHEALEIVRNGLTNRRLTHKGKHFAYSDVPMELTPLQKPHPPIWYPSSNEQGSAMAAASGFNYCTLGPTDQAKRCVAAYRAALDGKPAAAGNDDFDEGAAIGVLRHIVIADSTEEAEKIAQPAYNAWYANLTKLERDNKSGPKITTSMFADVNEAVSKGSVVIGTADHVRAELERQIDALGINYMVIGFFFGTLSMEHAMRSLERFADQVMPALSGDRNAGAAARSAG